MRCPTCLEPLKLWTFQDSTVKGVRCILCDKRWWSDSVGFAIDVARDAAEAGVVAGLEFPSDAETEEAHDAWTLTDDSATQVDATFVGGVLTQEEK